jgi:hypothetical protein
VEKRDEDAVEAVLGSTKAEEVVTNKANVARRPNSMVPSCGNQQVRIKKGGCKLQGEA